MREVLSRWIETPRMRAGSRIVSMGISPSTLTVAGFVASLLTLPLVAKQYYAIGLAVFLVGRIIRALAAPRGDTERDETTALPAVLDSIAYAIVPFAFALADPGRALASSFLLFGLVVAGAASRNAAGIGRVEAATCTVAYALACIFPDRFSLIAYVLGIACFVAAGIRLAGSRA